MFTPTLYVSHVTQTLNTSTQGKEYASMEEKQPPFQQILLHNEASQTKAEVYSGTAGYRWSQFPP